MARFLGRFFLDGLVLITVLLAAWQASHLFAGDVALTSPYETFRHLLVMLSGRVTFWPHVLETGLAFAYGLVLAISIGLGVGLLFGLHRLSGDVGEPIVVTLYSIPKVTLYPVILLFFGIGMPAKVVFGAIHGIVPIALFTMNAVRNIKPVLLKTGRAYRLDFLTTLRTILFPAVLPEVFTGLRVGFATTLVGTIVGEMFGAVKGLGFLLMRGVGLNEVKMIMGVALFLVIVAFSVNSLLLAIDHRLHRQI
jgi:NitT/TauT family transport system permease protein